MTALNLLHQKFGRLTVLSKATSRNKRAYWNCLCDCGNTKEISAALLRSGKTKSCGCLHKEVIQKQGKSNRHNEEYVKQKFLENGYELLSKYNGIPNPVTCRCLICNHIFTRRAQTNLYNQHGCPVCARQNNSILTEKYFNLHPELKNKPCKIYLINLVKDNEDFYKIGITTRTLQRRFRNIPYQVKNIETIETSYYEAFLLENKLKEAIKEYKYLPKTQFDGWTECFIAEAPTFNLYGAQANAR
jgi:hypothetical protein